MQELVTKLAVEISYVARSRARPNRLACYSFGYRSGRSLLLIAIVSFVVDFSIAFSFTKASDGLYLRNEKREEPVKWHSFLYGWYVMQSTAAATYLC